jgi:flagella basal body P-ring formation protein FlgA
MVVRRVAALVAPLASAALLAPVLWASGESAVKADVAIAAAIRSRLAAGGEVDVDVDVLAVDLPGDSATRYTEARPDPGARLGRPMRFRLRSAAGRTVTAVATVRVTIDQVITRHAIARGDTIDTDAVENVRREAAGLPLRRLPSVADVVGSRALRPMAAGAVVLPGSVFVRRAVEAGDRVTVVARAGTAEVTASLVAADGGEPGEVVRMVNPATRREIRGRVIARGMVEVSHAR